MLEAFSSTVHGTLAEKVKKHARRGGSTLTETYARTLLNDRVHVQTPSLGGLSGNRRQRAHSAQPWSNIPWQPAGCTLTNIGPDVLFAVT